MSGDESIFSNLDTSRKSRVRLGNGALVQSKGKGMISVQTNIGTKHIDDVLLVPSLDQNLLIKCWTDDGEWLCHIIFWRLLQNI